MNLNNYPLRTAEQNPSQPETLWFQSFASEAKDKMLTTLLDASVEMTPDAYPVINSALDPFINNLYSSLYLKAEAASRVSEVMNGGLQVSKTEFITNRNNKLHEEISKGIEESSKTLATAIAHYIKTNNGYILNSSNEQKLYISPANAIQISSVIHGLGLTLDDPKFADTVYDISSTTPSENEQISKDSIVDIYRTIASAPANPLVAGVNHMAADTLSGGQLAPTAHRIVKSATELQLLNNTQKKMVFDYALTQIADAGSSKVINELVRTGGLPPTVAINSIQQAMASNPANAEAYKELIANLNKSPKAHQDALRRAYEKLEVANAIASHDISNPALSGSKWLALAGFYGGALSSILNVTMAIASGNPSGAFASLPTAALAVGSFQYLQGVNPLDLAGKAARAIGTNDKVKQQLNTSEWANMLAKSTLNQPPASLNLLTSDKFISILKSSVDPKAEMPQLNLAKFEKDLKATDLSLYSSYFENYANDFSQNRDQLVTNLTQNALGYNALGINSQQDFLNKVAKPRGVETISQPHNNS